MSKEIEYSEENFREVPVEELNEDDGWHGAPFNPNLIDIASQAQALSNIVAQIEEGEIDLAPAFQRSGNLWDAERQSRLIESILLRIPLPAFYFDVEELPGEFGIKRSCWHVIDGLQRLCAIKNFVAHKKDGESDLKLRGLEFLHNLEGKTYSELARPYQRIINETQLTVYLVKGKTPLNVKFNIFKRVNTGGVPLTPQEIRHALNQGVPSEFLKELAESDHFRIATGNRIRALRMLDREFVNRFLAFYLLDRDDDEDMDAYYCRALECLDKMESLERDDIRFRFYESLDVLYTLFGNYAFCKLDRYPRVKPINKVLFEVMTVSVARLSQGEREALLKAPDALGRYRQILSVGGELLDLVSANTGNVQRVKQRYSVVNNFLRSLMEAL